MSFSTKIKQIFKIKDLRNGILFIFGAMIVFRILAHIPLPGINAEALKSYFGSNQMLGMLNIFSGGGMENFSVVMMGIGPYITASIIIQLLSIIIPRLEEISKEPGGQEKKTMYTRYLTVPLAALQSFGMIKLLQNANTSVPILGYLDWKQTLIIILTVTAGTMFLVWLGELITEKNLGNGISIMILAGIVTGIPSKIQQIFVTYNPTQIRNLILFVIISIITIVAIIMITEGRRKIPVSYARQTSTGRAGNSVVSHLPIPINMAGMIPIIFSISIIMFPQTIAQFFIRSSNDMVANIATKTIEIMSDKLIYGVLYFILVFAFTYFYTYIVFHPDQMAENLQRQGGFIPGIRPGKHTQDYLSFVTNRILFPGALFLAIIATMPLMMQKVTNDPNLAISGASMLIVVGVIIEIVSKIDSQLTMRDYEGLN
jgi:preprotein translocase subunit SecY